MNTHKKVISALLSMLAIATTTSCANAVPTSNAKTGQQPVGKLGSITKNPKAAQKTSPYITKELGDLTPLPSGAGVLFGEPVVLPVSGANNDLGNFGAACSRWLQFHVGGQVEMGKTPLWATVEATRRYMHKPTLRLAKSDIPQVTRALGLTHVAISTIKPLDNSDHYSLEFQLFDTSPTKLAAPIKSLTLKGTKAEILAQLPQQAVLLSATLGAKSARLPEKIDIQPDEMQLLGKGGWTFAQSLTVDELKQLHEVAAREPLAALLSLEYEARTDVKTEWQYYIETSNYHAQSFGDSVLMRTMVDTLLTNPTINTLALAEIFSINLQQALTYRKQLMAFIDKNQNNYAVQFVDTQWWSYSSAYSQSTLTARKALRCAPQNPYAWIQFGSCISEEADSVRGGRITAEISDKEWEFITPRYEQHRIVAIKATTLDPQNPEAWSDLAVAATFGGDSQTADNAFWKAYKLDPDNLQQLRWGLQMYQPKWMWGKEETLDKLIKIASTPKNLAWIYFDVASTVKAIDEDEKKEKWKAIQKTAYKEWEDEYQKDRNNVLALANLLNPNYGSQGRWGNYVNLTISRPNSALAYWLAAEQMGKTDSKGAIPYYRRGIELDPRNPILARDVTLMLINIGNYNLAEKELKDYIVDHDYDSRAYYYLGWINYQGYKDDLTLEYYKKALERNPDSENPYIYSALCDIQTRKGQLDKALANGRKGIDFATSHHYDAIRKGWAHSVYAWALFKKGRQKEAVNECKLALIISKDVDPGAHMCLAEINLAQGNIAEARAEWEKVIASVKNTPTHLERSFIFRNEAIEMLDKHPAA